MQRAVIDTNVLLEGLTAKGESGEVVDAWRDRRFLPCISTALALEYEEILLRRFPLHRHGDVQAALQALLDRSEYVPIYFRVRPASPDSDDDFLLECAFNGDASLVSRNDKDLRAPCHTLKIEYLNPADLMIRLRTKE